MFSAKDKLGESEMTKLHWQAWFAAAMGIFLDGFDLFIIAVALPLLNHEFAVDAKTLGLIGAAAPIGCILGSAFLGRVTDRLGRRMILLVDVFFFVVFAGMSALAQSVEALIFFRFLLGIGIGADYPVSSTYLTELMPTRLRGKMLVGSFGFQALGALVGAGLGVIILKFYPYVSAWRWMLGFGIVPAVIVLWLRLRLPESPRWLIEQGRLEEAEAATKQFVGSELEESASQDRINTAKNETSFLDLFSSRYIRKTALTSISWFIMDIAYYGVGFFTPIILAAMAFESKGDYIARDIAATQGAVFIDIFLVIGILLAVVLVERLGRIRLQAIGFFGMAIGLLILAASNVLVDHPWHVATVFTGFIMFNLLVNMGPNPITFLLPAEMFPTHIRATGHGFASAAGKIGAAVGIFLLPIMREKLGISMTLVVIAFACLGGFLITALLGYETKGKSLEDIERVEEEMDKAEVELMQVQTDIRKLNSDMKRVENALMSAITEIKKARDN